MVAVAPIALMVSDRPAHSTAQREGTGWHSLIQLGDLSPVRPSSSQPTASLLPLVVTRVGSGPTLRSSTGGATVYFTLTRAEPGRKKEGPRPPHSCRTTPGPHTADPACHGVHLGGGGVRFSGLAVTPRGLRLAGAAAWSRSGCPGGCGERGPIGASVADAAPGVGLPDPQRGRQGHGHGGGAPESRPTDPGDRLARLLLTKTPKGGSSNTPTLRFSLRLLRIRG